MEDVELSETVFEDFTVDPSKLYGGYFTTGYTYQIICAGVQLYHKGRSQLAFVTSPEGMARANQKLGEYVAWHDDERGNTWKKWLHTLVGGITREKEDINAKVLEGLIDELLLWYVGKNDVSKYFIKFGILRTCKVGRQVSK